MSKHFYIIILSFMIFVSCSFFERKNNDLASLEIDTVIDFNSVDAYPLFPNCNEISTRKEQQTCFKKEIVKHFSKSFEDYSPKINSDINDTIIVKLKISSEGKTNISDIIINDKTKELLTEIDSILNLSLKYLPRLQPAIKRNMPVTVEFTLPIIISDKQI